MLHLVHLPGENLRTFLFGILIPMVATAGLLAGGIWLWRRGLGGAKLLRVGLWCLVGAGALSTAVALTISYELAEGVVMSDPLYVVAGQASVGSVFGFVVGVYDVRQRAARSRAEAMGNQLTVLNRVLRHDIRNGANVIVGVAQLLAEETENEERAATIQRHALRLVELGDHARDVERLLIEDEPPTRPSTSSPSSSANWDGSPTSSPTRRSCDRYRIPSRYAPTRLSTRRSPTCSTTRPNTTTNGPEDRGPVLPRGGGGRGARRGQGRRQRPRDAERLRSGLRARLRDAAGARGLGLWLVNWIVETSGGRVRFEENDPSGSVVRLRLRPSG